MTRRPHHAADRPRAEAAGAALRWIRIIAMATGALILASCRSLSTPVVAGTALATLAADADVAAEAEVAAPPAASAGPQGNDSSWEAAATSAS
ncbi:MAG: hypothetical protein EBR23_15540, partial [Planctomycetia bacterium]|nr:hypothetical protein [Planctomycetia bacterium]